MKFMKFMKFIIDRKTWYRGQGKDGSMLLRPDGDMCCIGQIAEQCAISRDKLLHVLDLHSDRFIGSLESFPDWFTTDDGDQAGDLLTCYGVNDSTALTDEVREAELKKIFFRHGDELEFVN